MKRFLSIVLFLITMLTGGKAADYTTFHNITMPYDANIVNCIEQDDKGLIWLGTKRGLFSYNGYQTHQYTSKTVQSVIQFDEQYLCIGTDDGINWLNLKTGLIEDRYPQLSRVKAVRSLLFYKNILWIGTRDEGLFMMNLDSGQLIKSKGNGFKETMIFALEKTDRGIFVGSHEGLSFEDFATGQRVQTPIKSIVYSLLYDDKTNCLWVGTEGALYKYNIKNKEIKEIIGISGNSIKTIARDKEGTLLLGTNAGLYVYDDMNLRHIIHNTRNPQSLCNNVVSDILCDKNSNLWFATDRGISVMQMQLWYQSITLSELTLTDDGNVFSCLLRDSQGDYWLGGENGLLHIKGDKVRWFNTNNGLKHNHIRHVYEDRDGEIWLASDGSIAHYDRDKDEFLYFTLTDWKDRNADWAYSVYEDREKRLWVATYMGGLYVVDKQSLLHSNGNFKQERNLFGDSDEIVSTTYQIEPDEQGNLWMNTGVGLVMVNVNTLEVVRKNVYLDNMIYADNAIWLSSLGQLYKYDIKRDQVMELPFKQENGMIFAFVYERNRVWFSTFNGLYYVNTKDNEIHASYSPETDYLTGIYDSLRNEIIWGGADHITRFYLNKVSPRRKDEVVISGILLSDELYKEQNPLYEKTIRLSNNGHITFELSSLTYYPQNNEVFYYKLGDDKEWHRLGKGQNLLTFADMPYGYSLLSLSNTNPLADNDASISVYRIYVPYPWYLRWWSLIGYALLVMLLIWGFVKNVQHRNRRKYEEREREKSLELSRQKMDFFVNASHELKTPLSLIIAPLSRMISETTNSRQRESLKAIHKNSLRLNDLIYRILDFKQMEYESEDILIRSHVELCSLLQNCIQSFSSEISQRHITINFQSDVETLWLNGDTLKLESVFINLISNAVKYVPDESGVINVKLVSSNDSVTIVVSDNGKGMAEEDIPMMFIRFFQGKNSRNGGTGIGLYLVRKFVELHNGKVDVQNANGLTVKVTLPRTGENAIAHNEELYKQTEKDIKEATLLIVDDNEEIVDFLAESLSKTYLCLKAYNGKEGQTIIGHQLPDLIIVDQMMPEMTGLEFTKWIRHNQSTANLPVIMLTAKDDTTTELESIRAGVDVFISKPFDIKKVLLHIVQLLQRRKSIEKAANIEHIINPEFNLDDNRSADEILMGNITKTIENHIEEENFNVTQLSQYLNLDQKQLYRKIKQLTGMTPISFLKKLRMKKAAVLLKENKFTVSEVMFMVGYTNASYFSKCFSEEFGISPKQYAESETPIK